MKVTTRFARRFRAIPNRRSYSSQRDPAGRVVSCSPNKILVSDTTTLRPFKRLLPIGFQTDYAIRTRPVVTEIDKKIEAVFADGFENPAVVPLTFAIDLLKPYSDHAPDGG